MRIYGLFSAAVSLILVDQVALILGTQSAHAGVLCASAPQVLACYHPSATYSACEEDGRQAVIFFKGGISHRPYQLVTQAEYRPGFFKLTALSDNAPFAPNSKCDEWYPLNVTQ